MILSFDELKLMTGNMTIYFFYDCIKILEIDCEEEKIRGLEFNHEDILDDLDYYKWKYNEVIVVVNVIEKFNTYLHTTGIDELAENIRRIIKMKALM